jgi:hypothetical protein
MFYLRDGSVMKYFVRFAVLSVFGCVVSAPAFADANSVSTTANPQTPAAQASIPKRFLGAVVGTVVGTPVCFVRGAISDEKDAIQGMVGDTENKVALVSAGAFWLPFGLTTGFLSAPFSSFKHSMCSTDKPFSKEQFSLATDSQ